MAAQRAAEMMFETMEQARPTANHLTSIAWSWTASASGSAYQMTAARIATPTTMRTAVFSGFSGSLAGLATQQVLRPPLRLVVDAREQLSNYPRGDELHADQHQQHAEEKEGAAADVAAEHDLLRRQPGEDQESDAAEREAEATEGLQRSVQEAHRELDPQKVEQHPERAVDAVLRHAARARVVAHRHFDDLGADLGGERRDEAMQLAVEAQPANDVGAIHLERAAVVVQLDAGDARDHAVRHHRRQLARDGAVLPLLAPAGDHIDIRPLFEQIEEPRDVVRIILQVAVERDDDLALRRVEARL